MPKTKFQDIIFTIMMVLVMVYGMVCYNVALHTGGMHNTVFLEALKELIIMVPIAFILEFFLISKVTSRLANKIVDVKKENPFHMILAMSTITVIFMCPIMSFIANLLFTGISSEFIAIWLQSMVLSFPMALCFQLFYAGPFVRFIFRKIFRQKQIS